MPYVNLILLIVIISLISIYIDRRWVRNRGKAEAANAAESAPGMADSPVVEETSNGSA